MLLIVSSQSDATSEFVLPFIEKPVIQIFYNEDPLPDYRYEWDGGKHIKEYKGVDLSKVTSVWYKIGYSFYYKEVNASFEQLNRLCREEITNYLTDTLEDAFWLSHPYAIKRAENKQLQLEIASRLGMHIPLTLVTSSPEHAERFREKIGNIIVKPIAKNAITDGSTIKAIYTSRITPSTDINFQLLTSSPAIFQEEVIREHDVRTIVVDDKVFSLAIKQKETEGVDYRQIPDRRLEYKPTELPYELASKCVELVRRLGVSYAALDFILGKDGKYYFLESNATGAWYFVQKHGNYPIAESIAKLLK